MTPIATAYLILGLVSFFWPFATLFYRRVVLGAQWLMMTALTLFGLSVVIYSSFFNTFLKGEYILVILYMLISMSVPPMTQMAVTSLTHRQGVGRMARMLIIPSLIVGIFMGASVIIGGADMYRLWIERGAEGYANLFFEGSWRYNLIVAVHFYFYWVVLMLETFFVAIYSVIAMQRFHQELDEYYTAETVTRPGTRLSYIAISVNCIAVVLSYIIFPFNRPRPLWAVIVFCIVQGVAIFIMGWLSYRTSYGAEQLHARMRRRRSFGASDITRLSREITNYVEKEKHFLEPDLSVFLLADTFRCSQDDVVDAVHHLHGTTFGEYIDSLRVEYASSLLLAEPDFDGNDPEQVNRLAHRCGYLSADAFVAAVRNTADADWLKS